MKTINKVIESYYFFQEKEIRPSISLAQAYACADFEEKEVLRNLPADPWKKMAEDLDRESAFNNIDGLPDSWHEKDLSN